MRKREGRMQVYHEPYLRVHSHAQVPPRRARPQDSEDAIEDTPVVHAGNATRFVRKHRFDESMLQFGSLNHAQDREINGQTACPLLEGERTYGGHREIDAIDPGCVKTPFFM